jgi:hypothetical protein
VTFDGLNISGAPGDGFEFQADVSNVAIRSAQISNVGGYGISMASGTVVDGFELTKSTIEASALGGIHLPLDDMTPSGSIFVTKNSLEDCCSGASGSTSSILISGSASEISIDNNVLQDLLGDAEYGILHDIVPFNDPTYLCSNEFNGAFTTANRYSVPGYPEYQLDSDSDLSVNACDCAPFDGTTYPGASEINEGIDNNCNGIVDEITGVSNFASSTLFVWPAQDVATSYEVIRSDGPAFGTCATDEIVTTPSWTDTAEPQPEGTYYYLVRALTPLTGSWGMDSSGTERTGLCSD